jgi:dienelactone hydrolase
MTSTMLWGGLRPIPHQVVVDACVIVAWIYSSILILSNRTRSYYGMIVMVLSCIGIFVWLGGSITNRWTISLPMIPLLIIHCCTCLVSHWHFPTDQCAATLLQAAAHGSTRTPVDIKQQNFRIRWLSAIVAVLCAVFILSAASLSVLFPAVELPPISRGRYDIGVIDLYIPMDINVQDDVCSATISVDQAGDTDMSSMESSCLEPKSSTTNRIGMSEKNVTQLFLPVRLMYPTHGLEKPRSVLEWLYLWMDRLFRERDRIPYLNPETSIDFCTGTMRFGAPDPLKSFGWLLHQWRLITLPLTRNAPLYLPKNSSSQYPIPLVVYSHGLGGTLDLYSYQSMSLAANGYMVLMMTHTDGTAPIVPQPAISDSPPIPRDENILNLYLDGKVQDYERARRYQNELRVHEYLFAVEYISSILSEGINESENLKGHATTFLDHRHRHQQMLRRYLQKQEVVFNETYFIGHSFGGATALTAAYRRPDLVHAVIAHEPAIGWASNDLCHSMFASQKLNGINMNDFGIDGPMCENNTAVIENKNLLTFTNSIHDLDILILSSSEWMDKNWGRSKLINEMYRSGRLGKNRKISYHGVVNQSHHNEFSDTSMLTPLWLARAVGMTGSRNPIDTAVEIATRTHDFLDKVRRQNHIN